MKVKRLSPDTLFYADLTNADLNHKNLNGIKLRGADLRNADLRFALIDGIKLTKSQVQEIADRLESGEFEDD